jgi:hypothetical protein
MAQIDFPNSPTLNQTFTAAGITWQWDGAKWNPYPAPSWFTDAPSDQIYGRQAPSWKAVGAPVFDPAVAYTGGQTVSYGGQLYAAIGTQAPQAWPGQPNFLPLATAGTVNVLNGGGWQNKFRNARFLIARRPGSPWSIPATGVMTHTLDGWDVSATGAAVTVQFTVIDYSDYGGLQINGAAGNTNVKIQQLIEAYQAISISSGNITFQAIFLNNGAAPITPTLQVVCPNTSNNWNGAGNTGVTNVLAPVNLQQCAAGTWTRIAYTFNAPGAGTIPNIVNGLGIIVSFPGLTTSGNIFALPDVRSTTYPVGLTPTNLVPKQELHTIPSDLIDCSRYYINETNLYIFSGNVTSGVNFSIGVKFPIYMKGTPTVVTADGGGSVSFPATPPTIQAISNWGFQAYKIANATSTGFYCFSFTADADLV